MAGMGKHVPLFVVGFIGMAGLRSIGDYSMSETGLAFGLVDPAAWETATRTISSTGSTYLIGMAMAAVGLSTSFSALKSLGLKPFALGLGGGAVVGAFLARVSGSLWCALCRGARG